MARTDLAPDGAPAHAQWGGRRAPPTLRPGGPRVREWLASLGGAYQTEGARDLRIDFLRGFAVLAMVVDHIGGPSWLYALTGGNRFYTSAAEGFIFISGLLVGVVYGRVATRDGFEAGMRRAVERAGVLYLLSVGVTLPLLVVSELLGLPWATGVSFADPLALVLGVLALHRTYYLIDVMVLYTLLLTLAPVALYLLVKGRTRVVLAASCGLWLAFQIAPDAVEVPWLIEGNYLFNFAAWQVFFFTAMVLGYHRDRVARWFPRGVQWVLLGASGLGFAGLVALYQQGDAVWHALAAAYPALGSPDDLATLVFGKGDVRPGRVLASVIVFGFLFLLVTVAWRPLVRALGWLLLPLGRNALYAYTAHIVLVVLLAIALLPVGGLDPTLVWANTLLQAGGILLIWVLVQRRVFAPRPETRLQWALVPAGLAVAVLLLVPFEAPPTQAGAVEPFSQTVTSPRRQANAFGTPVPRGAPRLAPPGVLEGRPLPEPRVGSDGLGAPGTNVLPDYVGPLRGALLRQWFYSRALEQEMPYLIYLPPDYHVTARAYPVLYLLHGASGAMEEWPAMGLIDLVDQRIATRRLEPFIIVMPYGHYGLWINHAWDGPRWGDYVTFDLVAHIDSTYRTVREPGARAIGGLSVGGTGALVQAFNYPDIFGIVGAHSPTIREDNSVITFLGVDEEFAERDPVSLARDAPGIERLHIWIDFGDADEWYTYAIPLHLALHERGVPHEWRIWPGEHSLEYTARHIPDYLRFYTRAFAAAGTATGRQPTEVGWR